jgi:hypothetical protein
VYKNWQANIFNEHKCKNSQQDIRELNQVMYKLFTLVSVVYPMYAKLTQHVKIIYSNISNDHINRCRKSIGKEEMEASSFIVVLIIYIENMKEFPHMRKIPEIIGIYSKIAEHKVHIQNIGCFLVYPQWINGI